MAIFSQSCRAWVVMATTLTTRHDFEQIENRKFGKQQLRPAEKQNNRCVRGCISEIEKNTRN